MCRLCGSVAPKGSTAACQAVSRTKACVWSARIGSRTAGFMAASRGKVLSVCVTAVIIAETRQGSPYMATVTLDDPSLYFNREMTWLEFNRRVLEEGQDPTVPLLERLKFLAIFESNLDEFYMVRVGGVQQKSQ